MTENEMDLTELRSKINEVDRGLIELLAQRLLLVQQVAQVKLTMDIPIHQPNRWQEVLSGVCDLGEVLGLDRQYVADIWNRIHEEALVVEQRAQRDLSSENLSTPLVRG